jgi:hypothetical protein
MGDGKMRLLKLSSTVKRLKEELDMISKSNERQGQGEGGMKGKRYGEYGKMKLAEKALRECVEKLEEVLVAKKKKRDGE